MNLPDLLESVSEPACLPALDMGWEESAASLPAERLPFLVPDRIQACLEWSRVEDANTARIFAMADTVATDPALQALAWHMFRQLYETEAFLDFRKWPSFENYLEEEGGLFYLLIIVGAILKAMDAHQAAGIPEPVSRDTCYDLKIAIDRFSSITGGKLGCEQRLLGWFRGHAAGELFRIGRMQYVVRPFRGKLSVFRHLATGDIVALMHAGARFNRSGYYDGDGGQSDFMAWTSQFSEDENQVRGNPINPRGFVEREVITLDKTTWVQVLGPGDPVLEMHIPEGGGMTPDRCRDSMERALEFFPRYFPEKPFNAFACYSWIFNTQLQEILPYEANLNHYQRQLYLYPWPSNGRAGLYFIFYQDEIDVKSAPRDTSLRRAILEHLERGNILRNGAMFFFPEHLPQYGSNYYISHWPPRALEAELK